MATKKVKYLEIHLIRNLQTLNEEHLKIAMKDKKVDLNK